jgi:hypothetical protein
MGRAAVSEIFFSALQTAYPSICGSKKSRMINIGTILSGDFDAYKPISSDENAEACFAQVAAKQIHHIGLVFNTKDGVLHGMTANNRRSRTLARAKATLRLAGLWRVCDKVMPW